ncbi:uncharacterized protein [Arachis hypogaea]|uniref:uncharacterized protein n=1 Tax=Arachis hypogaea TaxID=3818 RepID=UPI003B218D3A
MVFRAGESSFRLAHLVEATKAVLSKLPNCELHGSTHQLVRSCAKCQESDNFQKIPSEELSPITASRSFAIWGVDLMGPFPTALGQLKYLIVAIDYFTKDLETLLLGRTPQANGQVKATNKVILKGIKKRLEQRKGNWAEEFGSVLWSYCTTPQLAMGETPFYLTYGTETVISVKIREPSPRFLIGTLDREVELDLLDEVQELAHLREAALKQRLSLRYNRGVNKQAFNVGDLVLRQNDIGAQKPGKGKLVAN